MLLPLVEIYPTCTRCTSHIHTNTHLRGQPQNVCSLCQVCKAPEDQDELHQDEEDQDEEDQDEEDQDGGTAIQAASLSWPRGKHVPGQRTNQVVECASGSHWCTWGWCPSRAHASWPFEGGEEGASHPPHHLQTKQHSLQPQDSKPKLPA